MLKRLLLVAFLSAGCGAWAEHHSKKVAGKWIAQATLPDGEIQTSLFVVSEEEGKLVARVETRDRPPMEARNVVFENGVLSIDSPFERDGWEGRIGLRADLDDKGNLKGKWHISRDGERSEHDWKASRSIAPVLPGTWKVTAEFDGGDNEHQLVISKQGEGISGLVRMDNGGEGEIDELKAVKMELHLKSSMNEGEVTVKASLEKLGSLKGRWQFRDSAGSLTASGAWRAVLE